MRFNRSALTIFLIFSSAIFAVPEKEICVIIPSYNNKDWYQRNLTSVLQQNYSNYHVMYIDDCSPDGTGELVEEFLQHYDHHKKVTLIKNLKRVGALANHWKAVHMIPDHVIVVHCDGDDWFAHRNVLQRVNEEYQDPDTWMTYGQFVSYPSQQMGHCRQTPLKIAENNSWRESLLLRWSHLRTFYAWLFKQIKLDDLMHKNSFFGVACDNAFMYPMLEMAQYHVRFIPDVLYVYNNETPLNDYKLRLDEHLATAGYIKQKNRYIPLQNIPQKQVKEDKVDCLIFSFDRPMQLYALLESMNNYMSNLGAIVILYRVSDESFEQAYQEVKQVFPEVVFKKQDKERPHETFKNDVLTIINGMPHDYLMFGVDDIIVKDYVNFSVCIEKMKTTHAYGFFLRLGKNITKQYLADVSLNRDNSIKDYLEVEENLCAWQFKYAKKDWAYPNTLDMTIYKKDDVLLALHIINFTTPNNLEAQWYGISDFTNIGLSYAESKAINIPLNIVQETKHNKIFSNHITHDFSVKDLLDLFNNGFKIDINPLFNVNNISPHMDYMPTFARR